ncbi:hypothetical protein EYF80_056003 [Liparis tanakae]|uniref:Uncharacterized protein n=1 Tax=Liparis tanakae TaxID=230148 RepID=A0A4Z2EZ16_9TELE|nr:hypothetical protein EYF80_056003 [Liparis tanakae]
MWPGVSDRLRHASTGRTRRGERVEAERVEAERARESTERWNPPDDGIRGKAGRASDYRLRGIPDSCSALSKRTKEKQRETETKRSVLLERANQTKDEEKVHYKKVCLIKRVLRPRPSALITAWGVNTQLKGIRRKTRDADDNAGTRRAERHREHFI